MEGKDNNIEEKQEYLRKEIIEKGLSPDDFINYITNLKGENAYDLNLWNLKELQDIVEQYKESLNPKIQEEQKEEKKEEIKDEKKEELKKELKDDEFIGGDGEDLWGNKIEEKSKPINCIVICKKIRTL